MASFLHEKRPISESMLGLHDQGVVAGKGSPEHYQVKQPEREKTTRGPFWVLIEVHWNWIVWLCAVYVWYNIIVMFNSLRPQVPSKPGVDVPVRMQRLWGQYSPYYPAGKYVYPPEVCNITQLHRHGARYPAHCDVSDYRTPIEKLLNANKYKAAELKFLKNYEYMLDEEHLVPLGAQQSWESGVEVFTRYNGLVRNMGDVFVRASDMERVVDTARNWTQGFADASHGHLKPVVSVLLSEEINNTLNNDCPNASEAEGEMATWIHQFAPPIAKRLNKKAPGANLTEDDIFGLMAMCPFESIAWARARTHEDADGEMERLNAHSKFCDLFSEAEWLAFDYHGDVEKYYRTGPGNPLGPVQGVGYVNELLARLTGTPVRDHTQHNTSLPFPLGRQVYADFTHENLMVAVYAAMGLFGVNEEDAPDPTRMPKEDRVWKAGRMVPFSGRMVVERLECARDAALEDREVLYVRIFVNDALQQLEFCGAKEGMCRLDVFVENQRYARVDGDGDFKKCYS